MSIQIFQCCLTYLTGSFSQRVNRLFLQRQAILPKSCTESCTPLLEIKDILGVGHIFDIPASSGNQIIHTISDSFHSTEGNAMIFISKIIIINHHWLSDRPKRWKLIRLHLCCIQDHTCHISSLASRTTRSTSSFFCGKKHKSH